MPRGRGLYPQASGETLQPADEWGAGRNSDQGASEEAGRPPLCLNPPAGGEVWIGLPG